MLEVVVLVVVWWCADAAEKIEIRPPECSDLV